MRTSNWFLFLSCGALAMSCVYSGYDKVGENAAVAGSGGVNAGGATAALGGTRASGGSNFGGNTSLLGGLTGAGGTAAAGGAIAGSPSTGGSSSGGSGGITGSSVGGTNSAGGTTSNAGSLATGGNGSTGGVTNVGSSSLTGGTPPTGGSKSGGGSNSTGGAFVIGGTIAVGGTKSSGGTPATGGAPATGGMQTGGVAPTGGTSSTGGTTASGGQPATGGALTGGTLATGGLPTTGGTLATGGSSGCSVSTQSCNGNVPQQCLSDGTWQPQSSCSGGKPICSAGVCVACPGTGGPSMVGLPLNYCIDSTEVTQGQYQTWLNTSPSPANQISVCSSWNASFTPSRNWPPTTSTLNYPVVYVDWCDAYAYCAGVGKRLCGNIGGGSSGYGDFADVTKSQWYVACTSNGTYSSTGYPYGETYQATTCNGADANIAAVAVGTMPLCQSTVSDYAGVYDLSGNVVEWEDSCSGTAGSSDYCRVRGGSVYNLSSDLACGYNFGSTRGGAVIGGVVGFRCCSP